jgi:hypothetical protein
MMLMMISGVTRSVDDDNDDIIQHLLTCLLLQTYDTKDRIRRNDTKDRIRRNDTKGRIRRNDTKDRIRRNDTKGRIRRNDTKERYEGQDTKERYEGQDTKDRYEKQERPQVHGNICNRHARTHARTHTQEGCGKITSSLYGYFHIKKEVSLPHPILYVKTQTMSYVDNLFRMNISVT